MVWHAARVIYRLCSPLYIGYCRIGNVHTTRHFIPSRNLWAAVTERLTRCGCPLAGMPEGDYQAVGKWVEDHLAFTYFFIWCDAGPLIPSWGDTGLTYSGLSRYAFERRYVSAHVTTALDPSTTSAEAGSLHEVEYIAPKSLDRECKAGDTRMGGWVFLDEEAHERFGDDAQWKKWLGDLWVGGERRYGFGHLRLESCSDCDGAKLPAGYGLDLNYSRPRVLVGKDSPLMAHAPVESFRAKGMVEPLIGRETTTSASFGAELTPAVVCWTPGSLVTGGPETVIDIQGRNGIWTVPGKHPR